ncbi:MAG: hypothetical protein J5590_01965 [Clostridia bacterium]|nr:hypothetical protein [Clostridia bacterium]
MAADKVTHITFGKGKVTEEGDTYIKVAFTKKSIGEKAFVYPDAFANFLTYDDKELQKEVNKKLAAKKRKLAAEQKKLEKKKEEAINAEKTYTAMQMTAAQNKKKAEEEAEEE